MRARLVASLRLAAAVTAAVLLHATAARAQSRPTPGALPEHPSFTRAVQAGTRTVDGRPGPRAWTQYARYHIDARIDPSTHVLTGSSRVTYINNSPDTLPGIRVHLRQNAFAPGSARREAIVPTDGVVMQSVAVNGATPVRAAVNGTVMNIIMAQPLLPRDSVTLAFAWKHEVPVTPSDGRQGRDEHLYLMGYWYPQVAVYDDVSGWVADQYLLGAEFYMDHADYDVRITAPAGWVVGATGVLQNAAAILPAAMRDSLAMARSSGRVVNIHRPAGNNTFSAASVSTPSAMTTWHFKAANVRDFAWGTSDRYVWDATRALVASDTVDIHSFYRIHPPAAAWAIGGARYTKDAIEQLSRYLWPYPWPTMTSMEGVLTSGGMEYPMLTTMQPWVDTLSLAGDLMHETGHMWFPMQVGSNETRYPWMDEGFTQFNTAQAMRVLYGEPRTGGRPNDSEPGQRRQYIARALAGDDQALMQHGDLFPLEQYNVMYYNKTSQVLVALRSILGDSVFRHAFRMYGERWNGRHPYPQDFFNTVETVAGRDLDWFWVSWFQEPWSLDHAIGSARMNGSNLDVKIEDRGRAFMPVRLTITRAGGAVEMREIPVDVWLRGSRSSVVSIANGAQVVRVEIDAAAAFPDYDRTNQVWVRN